ncbi:MULTISPECIES: cytochrome c biogenesis protein CcdA [unclassified Roseitalea]|uniref:cytochrome c biogenesis CcdA family protein n=1 Tax=unclassified Roseitalea TaxID=2639107 RepID=UPI00273E5AF3|nr:MULTISPECIES: cytochrome c biogenesis protein CcdA [unclassified Roseitalea]
MAIDVSFAAALGAGAISFLSPCVLPLVPPYLCYMAGVSMDDFRDGELAPDASGAATARAAAVRLPLITAALAFIAGFTTVFVALGAGASTIGGVLRAWQTELAMVAGVIIIVMGLNFLGVFRIGLLAREARFQTQGVPANPAAAYLMGLAFAFGWTPCIGPVLGPILTLAGAQDSVGHGAALLAVYSAGLGIPFMIAAMFSSAFMRFLTRFRTHLGTVEKAIGVLLVLAGVLFLTGGMQAMAFWLLERFPALGQLG